MKRSYGGVDIDKGKNRAAKVIKTNFMSPNMATSGGRDKSQLSQLVDHSICQLCGEMDKLLVCTGCQGTYYCSKEHQKKDWKEHKKVCKSAKKSADKSRNTKSTSCRSINVQDPKLVGERSKIKESENTTTETSECTENVNTFADPNEVLEARTFFDHPQSSNASLFGASSDDFALNPTEDIMGRSTKKSAETINTSSDHTERVNNMTTVMTDKRNQHIAEYVIKCLNQYGICVFDNFLAEPKCTAILQQVKRLHSSGAFEDGQVVTAARGQLPASTKSIRGDKIAWVDGEEEGCHNIKYLMQQLDTIMMICNKDRRLEGRCISGRTKAMVACYPGHGTYYVRHVDNPNQDGRCVTCIYYLNQDWNVKTHGGLLRIFPQGTSKVIADIEPLLNRLLFFWSDRRNPHEVQPAHMTRYAITLWYFDEEERSLAKERYRQQVLNCKRLAAEGNS